MAVVNTRRKVTNPGRRRKLSRKQILAGFGGKRRQAAARPGRKKTSARRKARPAAKRRNTATTTRRNTAPRRTVRKKATRRRRTPTRNIGEILSVIPVSNSGTRRNGMTKRRGRRRTVRRRRAATHRPRRRRNYGTSRPRQARNYGYRRRRNTARRRNTGRRRNAGLPSSVGIIGGAMLTSVVSGFATRFFPAASAGPVRWVTTGLTAMLVGKGVGKITRNTSLGNQIQTGGLVLMALQVMADLAPGVMGSLPIGLQGMGAIAPSSFYSPQVPRPGSMTQFITPAATQAAVARYAPVGNGVSGIGRGRYAR